MVTEAQGQGDMIFPADATIGDYFTAQNNITYELMPDLRWRNVIPLIEGPFGDEWVPSLTPEGDHKTYSPPVNGANAVADIKWYGQDVFLEQGDSAPFYSVNTPSLPTHNEIFVWSEQAFSGSRHTWIQETFEDPSLPLYYTVPQPVGELWPVVPGVGTMWSNGTGISGFNRTSEYTLAIVLGDFLNDMARRDECTVTISYKTGRNYDANTEDGHSFKIEQFGEIAETKLYRAAVDYTAPTYFEDLTLISIPDRLANVYREITSPVIPIAADTNIVFMSILTNPGQFVSDVQVSFFDPAAPGTADFRRHCGLGLSRDGTKFYLASPQPDDVEYAFEATMSTPYDTSTAETTYSQTEFDGDVEPSSLQVDDGTFTLLMADENDGKLKHWGLLDGQLEYISKNGTGEFDYGWTFSSYKSEFLPVDPPLYAQFINDANDLAVLGVDGVLRVYDMFLRREFDAIEGDPVLQADTLDINLEVTNPRCFFWTPSGRSIVVPYTGGFKVYSMETPFDLTTGSWGLPVLLDIDTPSGITMKSDLEYMYILEQGLQDETNNTLKVSQFERATV